MTSPTPALVTSPALSATSTTSSYDLLSSSMMSAFEMPSNDDTDDQIVWSFSDSEGSSIDPNSDDQDAASDDDFVVLSPSIPPSGRTTVLGGSTSRAKALTIQGSQLHTPITASNMPSLEAQMAAMSLKAQFKAEVVKKENKKQEKAMDPELVALKKAKARVKRKEKRARARAVAAAEAYPTPDPSPQKAKNKSPITPPSTAVVKTTGLGFRPIVDDLSDRLSVVSGDHESTGTPSLYEEASTFISRFLTNPDAKNDSVCRLTLLQSLIIELGLASSNLPSSLRSAKTFLKAHAFLNIKEYIAVRGQGPEAVQKAMYPSRSALIKTIRKPSNRAPLKWVKDHGLQVLLVGWAH